MRLWRGTGRTGSREMVSALAAACAGPGHDIPKTKLKIVEKSRGFPCSVGRMFHIRK
jgi:hypothetical protein